MTEVGQFTAVEFEDGWPLDFGEGVRGGWIDNKAGKRIGVFVAHHFPTGEVCAGAVWWEAPDNNRKYPLWTLVSMEPLTLEPSIMCSCNVHGHIRNGKWEHTPDSRKDLCVR
jgi:hypothetical protein